MVSVAALLINICAQSDYNFHMGICYTCIKLVLMFIMFIIFCVLVYLCTLHFHAKNVSAILCPLLSGSSFVSISMIILSHASMLSNMFQGLTFPRHDAAFEHVRNDVHILLKVIPLSHSFLINATLIILL